MPALVDDDAAPGRLLLLSNRLPITIKRSDDGSYSFSMSSGGLVTGLSGLSKTTSFQWYGWPGLEVPENEIAGMKQRLKDEYNAHPVFIDDELADKHYNGFSSTIPPLLACLILASLMTLTTRADNSPQQTPSSGPCFTTTPVKSPSTRAHGAPTARSTVCSPRPSCKMSKMAI